MSDQGKRKRHRWKATNDHFYPGPKYWRCIKCGLRKTTEWEEKPTYRDRSGRKWHRLAPPSPPDGCDKTETPSATKSENSHEHA